MFYLHYEGIQCYCMISSANDGNVSDKINLMFYVMQSSVCL